MPTDAELAQRIEASIDADEPVETTLKTSERVLARVTDGIYRQPGSALRELVSNAYDADASHVRIETDRPRFSAISIEDDGAGMSPAALAHLLQNIGGSAKRRAEGVDLGVTAATDTMYSPGGRRLIGRIGIGLFSVSQLTQSFQIITKTEGDTYRTVAAVVMKQFGEEAGPGTEDDGEYEAGRVRVWREPASDTATHGTTVVLDSIRPQTRRTLQSDATWQAIERVEAEEAGDVPNPPQYNVGRVQRGQGDELRREGDDFSSVPWSLDDPPATAFRKLVDAVWGALGGATNPRLVTLFDDYLQMVWQLALSVPLEYVDGHPFAVQFGEEAYTYLLASDDRNGSAVRVELDGEETLASQGEFHAQEHPAAGPFTVFVDDLELARPLRFEHLPKTSHALKRSIMFAGRCRETFSGVPVELSGGPLSFEAYLLWNPKIAPTEHQGSLIRIHGASGTLFDPSFMRYQVSEQTRRQQTSCEIFVTEGLEGALNIDRESFNFAHPHVVFLTAWLHNAMRRLATTQKGLAAEVREAQRENRRHEQASELTTITADAWQTATQDEYVVPPHVTVAAPEGELAEGEAEDEEGEEREWLRVDGDEVIPESVPARDRPKLEPRVAAVASVLAAYGVADALPPSEFENLLFAITRILIVDNA